MNHKMIVVLVYFVLASRLCQANVSQPIVSTKYGDVLGSEKISFRGRNYYAFLGIPFAEPPSGALRFLPPVTSRRWTGVRDATRNGNACIQFSYFVIVGSEDCLVLYVYTPQLPSNSINLLPVVVFIHGGGFKYGHAQFEEIRPDFVMDYDIVFVAIQYRLGAFGFFSTGDKMSAGNFGMIDQVKALEWIQENIAAFGGDKNKVTIMGHSSGGVSVMYHILSPISTGLFHGAIVQSGAALLPTAIQKEPLQWAHKLASLLNCPIDNSSVLVDCLMIKDAKEIAIASSIIINSDPGGYTPAYAPRIENSTYEGFLNQQPETILKSGMFNKVPIIAGVTENECAAASMKSLFTFDDEFFEVFLPKFISTYTDYNRNLINVSYAVKNEYFDNINMTNENEQAQAVIDFLSDVLLVSYFDLSVRLLAEQKLPVYMYSFNYQGSFFSYPYGRHEVSHGDELSYLFYNPTLVYSPEDLSISHQVLSLWTDFATNLNSTSIGDGIWTPTSFKENLDYLQISAVNLSMAQGFLTPRMRFWEKTVPAIVNA